MIPNAVAQLRSIIVVTPAPCRRLRRPHKPDIHPAGVLRHDEHRLLAGVADSARRRREAVVGHPLRGGVHAGGAIQDLERSRAVAGEGVGAEGLIGQGQFIHVTMTGNGMIQSRTTDRGKGFIKYITASQ